MRMILRPIITHFPGVIRRIAFWGGEGEEEEDQVRSVMHFTTYSLAPRRDFSMEHPCAR